MNLRLELQSALLFPQTATLLLLLLTPSLGCLNAEKRNLSLQATLLITNPQKTHFEVYPL